jgi:hypothetical protein
MPLEAGSMPLGSGRTELSFAFFDIFGDSLGIRQHGAYICTINKSL